MVKSPDKECDSSFSLFNSDDSQENGIREGQNCSNVSWALYPVMDFAWVFVEAVAGGSLDGQRIPRGCLDMLLWIR